MSAVISECGQHRYWLAREVALSGITIGYFGVNPSHAGPIENDATVRKWIGFTKVLGGRRFLVGNVSSFRSTDVRELARVVISPEHRARNLEHLQSITRDADLLVPCWGNRSKAPATMSADFDEVMALLVSSGKPVMHFGLTQGGDPRHPLMLAYSTHLQPWCGGTRISA